MIHPDTYQVCTVSRTIIGIPLGTDFLGTIEGTKIIKDSDETGAYYYLVLVTSDYGQYYLEIYESRALAEEASHYIQSGNRYGAIDSAGKFGSVLFFLLFIIATLKGIQIVYEVVTKKGV